MNISNNEHKLLEVLWEKGEMQASLLYREMEKTYGWKKTTTYTVIDKCIEKGFIKRVEPNFVCQPLIQKSDVQDAKITDLIGDFFNNSKQDFIRAFLKDDTLSEQEKKEMIEMIERLK